MVVRIQLRHDTKANWITADPILLSGEVGIETDGDRRMKIGNGVHHWTELSYFDNKFLHNYGDEIASGNKEFEGKVKFDNEVTFDSAVSIAEGLVVDGTIQKAVSDADGVVFSDGYQKRLAKLGLVSGSTDWDEIKEEGVYSVEVQNWGEHTPYEADENIGKVGVLIVKEDVNSYSVQTYTPTGTIAGEEGYDISYITLYRFYNGQTWSTWKPYSAEDNTIVHIEGDETITGNKTFTGETKLLNDKVVFGSDGNATIQTLHEEAGSETKLIISSEGYPVVIRPNGELIADGEVTIDTAGVVHGKCEQDGVGRVINTTYATQDQIRSTASMIIEPMFEEANPKEEGEDTTLQRESYDSIVDRKYDSFDRNKFTVVGTPKITEDGFMVVSDSNYAYISKPEGWLNGANELIIKGRVLLTNLEGAQVIIQFDNANNVRLSFEGGFSSFCVTWVDGTNLKIPYQFQLGDDITYELRINTEGTFLSASVNGESIYGSNLNMKISDLYTLSNIIYYNNASYHFKGTYDLRQSSVSVNGEEIFCGRKNGIDIIKKDNFTIIGTPTITNDGVAYGFSSANCIKSNYTIGEYQDIEFVGSFTTGDDVNTKQAVISNGESASKNLAIIMITNGVFQSWLGSAKLSTYQVQPNTTYNYRINSSKLDNTYNFYVSTDNKETWQPVLENIAMGDLNFTDCVLYIGRDWDTVAEVFLGSIDLNSIRIHTTSTEYPDYQPCLRIPYTFSNRGVKIVEAQYADRVLDCYNQFRTGNYFVLDEVNERYRVPFDSANGLNHIIYSFRNGTRAFEYDTNLECTQTGTAEANVPVILPKAMADTNYVVSIPHTAKTVTGFTPTESGDWVAKGRITLG